MKLSSYLQSAQKILVVYEFPQPFHLFLKTYFKTNKQFGSKDRKVVAAMLFGYFRIGKQEALSTDNAMLAGVYISGSLDEKLFEKLCPELSDTYLSKDLNLKLQTLEKQLSITLNANNLENYLSKNVDAVAFKNSLFTNPNVFIRSRVAVGALENKLQAKEIEYTVIGTNTICFAENLNLQEALPENKLYVVQDISSQQVCEKFKPIANEHWWDCCAASGGKSIALLDQQKDVQLTVSDVRENILHNLQMRFKQYNFSKYKSLVIDMCAPIMDVRSILFSKKFNKIICDVPCTGSGTWARTPEQMYFWKANTLENFQQKQIAILQNALACLEPKGLVFYLTCSVFAAENEAVLEAIVSRNKAVNVISSEYINNISIGGDTMFVAVLGLS